VGSSIRNVQFEAAHDGGPTQTFVNYDLTNPANFTSRGLWQELTVVSGKDWQARADLSYDVGEGFLKRLDVGVRYADRKAGRDLRQRLRQWPRAGVPLTAARGGGSDQPARLHL
jgi:iron complex outermembrane receptor protein